MNETGIIILAAGSSSRLGQPKQLLSYRNKSLIKHIVGEALEAKLGSVLIVTGAHAEQVSLTLKDEKVTTVFNERWQEGLASGIVAGIKKTLLLHSKLENVILSVCDQPFVTSELFQQLVEKKAETGKGVVACTYADTTGTPVLFDNNYFAHLQNLKGSEGAKKLLKIYKADVATIPFPKGNVDIDTEEDYRKLIDTI